MKDAVKHRSEIISQQDMTFLFTVIVIKGDYRVIISMGNFVITWSIKQKIELLLLPNKTRKSRCGKT